MEIDMIRAELATNVKKIEPLGKLLKFNLDENYILIDGTNGDNRVSDENIDANCTITMSIDTYLKLQRKEIKPFIATLKGQLKVKGDIGLAQKLKQMM